MNATAVKELLRLNSNLKLVTLLAITYTTPSRTEETVYYNNSERNIVYNSKTYEPYDFMITPATYTESSVTDGSLTLSAIDQVWIEKIRNMPTRPYLTMTYLLIYGDKEDKYDVLEEMTYLLNSANWNDTSIQWSMLYDDKMNLIFPCDKGTVDKIPALG